MKRLLTIVSASALALAMVLPANAQTGAKTPKTKTPVMAKSAKPQIAVKSSKDLNKITGTVTKDAVTKGVLTIGVPKQGRIAVDTNGAKVRTKDGKFFSVNKIVPGSNITVQGKLAGKSVKATEIIVNYTPAPSKKSLTPTSSKPIKPVKAGGKSK